MSRGHFAWICIALLGCPSGPGPKAPTETADGGGSTTSTGKTPAGDVASIACGDFHSCVLMRDKTVRCWGRNKNGELGDGTDTDHSTPVVVKGIGDAEEIALGANFTCIRTTEKTVKCWGSGRLLGDPKIQDKLPPTVVPGISNIVEIRAGGYMICARNVAGDVSCWGLDPKPGGEPKGATDIAVAGAHGCARLSSGVARCWGEGIWSPTAKETFANPNVPNVKMIATGDSFACVYADVGVSCWGRNDEGELGVQPDSDNHTTAQLVPGITNVLSLVAGESHVCAIVNGSSVACWGANDEGELGRGTRTLGEKPQPIEDLHARSLAVGADHVCAITIDGSIYCWGSNRNGQIGDGTTERKLKPTRVQGL